MSEAAQMALEWSPRQMTTTKTPLVDPGTCGRAQNGKRDRFALRSDGDDWSRRDDPLPDPSSLLRHTSPRCLCNNGCRQVFASESTYDRHLEMLPNGDARCRTATELRALKRPLFRDIVGVWHAGTKREENEG